MSANQSAFTSGVELRNEEYLAMVRDEASLEYQMRIPDPTKTELRETFEALQSDRRFWNEFAHTLINRIGSVVVRTKTFQNPFKEFKEASMLHGASVEEIAVGLVQAEHYSADKDYGEREVMGQAPIDIRTVLHHINREDKYKITMNDKILRRAFLSGEGSFNTLVNEVLSAPLISDEWDEFLIACRLFGIYEETEGFYKINVPDVKNLDSDSADARLALRKLRATADNLTYLSSKYNAGGMPTAAQRDELIMFCTPEFKASVDVEALAAAFNISHMDFYGRMITIPAEHLNIPGCQAILTTKRFFVMKDTLVENTAWSNPGGLYHNYWLHHHGIYSVSRFAPAVMFTSNPVTETIRVVSPVTSVTTPVAEDRDGNTVTAVDRGGLYWVKATGQNAEQDDTNTEVKFSVSGNESTKTRIDEDGALHIGHNETAETITVTAATSWANPETGVVPDVKSTVSLTVAENVPEDPEG